MQDQSRQRGLERSIIDLQRGHEKRYDPQSKSKSKASFAPHNECLPSNHHTGTPLHSRPGPIKQPPPKPSRKPSLRLKPVQLGLFNPVKRDLKAAEEVNGCEPSSSARSTRDLAWTMKRDRVSGPSKDSRVGSNTHRSFLDMERDLKLGIDSGGSILDSPQPLVSNITQSPRKASGLVHGQNVPIGRKLHATAMISQQSPHETTHRSATGNLLARSNLRAQSKQLESSSSRSYVANHASGGAIMHHDVLPKSDSKHLRAPIKPPKPAGHPIVQTQKFTSTIPQPDHIKHRCPRKPTTKHFSNSVPSDRTGPDHKILPPKPSPPIKPTKYKLQEKSQLDCEVDQQIYTTKPEHRLLVPQKPHKPANDIFARNENNEITAPAIKLTPHKPAPPAKPSKPSVTTSTYQINEGTQSGEVFLKNAASRLVSPASRDQKNLKPPMATPSGKLKTKTELVAASPARPSKTLGSIQADLEHKIGLSATRIGGSSASPAPGNNFQDQLAVLLRSSTAPVSSSRPAVDSVVRSSTSVEKPKVNIQHASKPRSKGPKRRLPKKFV